MFTIRSATWPDLLLEVDLRVDRPLGSSTPGARMLVAPIDA
jgi:hypothetical protein